MEHDSFIRAQADARRLKTAAHVEQGSPVCRNCNQPIWHDAANWTNFHVDGKCCKGAA